ncbi:contractile injection system protein, VgrG/Pvc8 family [Lacrimispora sp.]|jgi:hypothetical protein|uniref:contractile injection system protein, VgrG/Pvc8 family n=1 Tax=Lacrimispora sp. TaxID=2719234 RepID=UPI002898CEC1|nr:contractile injection system protein, VgrG/Pvc8 family [Lacrimispora sp.]
MREEKLIIRPFEDIQILDYKSIQKVNEHALAEVRGRIPFNRKEDYMKIGRRQTWAQVVAVTAKEETILFYGVIEQLRLEIKDGTCIVVINLCSGTQLMDYEEHIRSFQKEELTYSNLLDICTREYEDAAKIVTEGQGKAIRHFIIQYRETDWEFIKRLASMNHTVVFADCSTKGTKYHFGIPDRKIMEEILPSEYQTQYDMKEYWHKKNHGISIHSEDTMSYIWESREIYKLGERRTVDGRDLFIWKMETCLKGNELYHTYFMKPRLGIQEPVSYNSHLTGVSLSGSVIKVKDEKVQIKINSDENKEESGACWYSFSTVYSSADGTGWYCMPEIGDTVRLYFPTAKEPEAYVASTYHESGAGLRKNPERKFWRNKEGKEIQLSPERILLTNNDGTYIELSDENGIEIVSEGSVTVRAGGSLNISTSSSSIEMSAPKKIRLKQGDTEMNLGGDIEMQGAKVML